MVCDKPNAYVIERAKNHNIRSFVFNAKNYKSKSEYEAEIIIGVLMFSKCYHLGDEVFHINI